MENIHWSFYLTLGLPSIIILLFLYKINKEIKKLQKSNAQILIKFKENEISMQAYQYERESELNEEWRSYAFLQLLAVREAVNKQTQDIFSKDIEDAPRNCGLDEKELSKAFTPDEILLIHKYFKLFENYIQVHWLNQNGKMKTIFRGSPNQLGSEVAELNMESKHLVKQLDKLIMQIKNS